MMRKVKSGMKIVALLLMILAACKVIQIAKQRPTRLQILDKNTKNLNRQNASFIYSWLDSTTQAQNINSVPSVTQDSQADSKPSNSRHEQKDGRVEKIEEYEPHIQLAQTIEVTPAQNPIVTMETPTVALVNPTIKPKPKLSRPIKQPETANLEVLYKESSDVFDLLPDEYLADYKSFCWWDRKEAFQCLPSVYLAGMPKCGTTDLFDKLTWHPQLVPMVQSEKDDTPIKERHYWSRGRVGRPGNFLTVPRRPPPKVPFREVIVKMGAKRVLQDRELRIVDGTPSLLWDLGGWKDRYPDFNEPPYSNADLIHAVSPDAKIIAILRDPVERLLSEYLYFWKGAKMRSEHRSPQTFHDEVQREVKKFETCRESHSLRKCCYAGNYSVRLRIALGVYICYIQDWTRVFGDELLVFTMAEYHEDPVGVLNTIFKHVGVYLPDLTELREFIQNSNIDNTNSDVKKSFGGMFDETRHLLHNFYQPFNEDLADFLKDPKYKFDK